MKRDKRSYSKFFSYATILALWLFVGVKGWAAYGEYTRNHEAKTAKPDLQISSAFSGEQPLSVTQTGVKDGGKLFDINKSVAGSLESELFRFKDPKGNIVDDKCGSASWFHR